MTETHTTPSASLHLSLTNQTHAQALERIAEDVKGQAIDVVLYVDRLDLYRVEPLDKRVSGRAVLGGSIEQYKQVDGRGSASICGVWFDSSPAPDAPTPRASCVLMLPLSHLCAHTHTPYR